MEDPGEQGSRAVKGPISIIVPVFNSLPYLRLTHESLLAAMRDFDGAELVYCDNGSEDGSIEFLERRAGPRITLLHVPGATVGGVRNEGARSTNGDLLLFLDSDCTVPREYLSLLIERFAATDAAAIGCRVVLPEDSHWIARTWHQLHFPRESGFVRWINSANFCIQRGAFEAIGGFSEAIETGEDAEIGLRLLERGFRLYQDLRLSVTHHKNPSSLYLFWRREVWRGLGAFGTARKGTIDKPLTMTLAFGVSVLGSMFFLAFFRAGLVQRILLATTLLLLVPLVTVFYRSFQRGRVVSPARSTLLYFLYYSARLEALVRLLARNAFPKISTG